MGPFEQIIHVLGFVAPACALAAFCAFWARWTSRWWLPLSPWRLWVQIGVGSVLGICVMLAGLWLFGVDGKMSTYAALVLTIATAQWLMCAAWRR